MLLTNQAVTRLRIPTGRADHIEWDEKLSGWGVRLNAGGKRSWVLQYRIGGRSTRVTFGSVEKMDADAARRQARIMLGKIEQGVDPAAEKAERTEAAAVTFGRQIDAYLDGKREKRRGRTVEEIERSLRQHWAPLHPKPLTGITLQAVSDRLDEIKRECGPMAANRSRSHLSGFFKWAMAKGKMGQRPYNPVAATEKPAEEKARKRKLSDAEIVAIWHAARDDDYGRIIRLLILTGQRRTEIGKLRRAEVNSAERALILPPERVKNGRTRDCEHLVPLSDEAVAILHAIDLNGRTFVFGRRDTGFSGWGKAKKEIDRRIGKACEPWILNDLRKACRSGLTKLGVTGAVAEAVVNHVSSKESGKSGVEGVYNLYDHADEKRQALDMWGAHVAALVAGKHGSNVVAMRGGK